MSIYVATHHMQNHHLQSKILLYMSNPLRSAGVRELEIVTLYAVVYGGSENVFYIINFIDTPLNGNS